jgi:hypothetical protein
MGAPARAGNQAVKATSQRVEKILSRSSAYRKVDDGLYVVKQGSTIVMATVLPWKETHAVVRLTAQLVKGVTMEVPLALDLLSRNAILRFGAFAYVPEGRIILFVHTMVDRELTDEEEFRDTLRDFALVADDYDDRIAARFGGQTMQDILEESVLAHIQRDLTAPGT